MPRRPKKPARKLPNIEARFVTGAWKWRARVTINGKLRVGAWRDTQREAHRESELLRDRAPAMKQRAITLLDALDALEERARARTEDQSLVERNFVGRRKFLLACWDGGVPLESIDQAEVDWLVTEAIRLGRSVPTIRKYLALLRQCFKHAGLVMPEVDLPKQRRKPLTFFTREEIAEIIDKMRAAKRVTRKDRDVAIASFVLLTGIRCEEFLRLRVEHFNFERKRIDVASKDPENPRQIHITERLEPIARELVTHALRNGVLLPSRNSWNLMWARWKRRLGITINGRLLRRSMITAAGYSGLNRLDVRDLAGHKHATTTDIYLQAISSRLHDAASRAQAFLDLPQDDETPPHRSEDPPA